MICRIGDILARIGSTTPEQIKEVLCVQQAGGAIRFGEIAIELHYLSNDAAERYEAYLDGEEWES